MRWVLPEKSIFSVLAVGLVGAVAFACGGSGGEEASASGSRGTEPAAQDEAPMTLGPRDGLDLPPTDIERVAVGTVAPDFSLLALDGETYTLSDFQGKKNVVLVFYRGHW
jgi:hypothetical protein